MQIKNSIRRFSIGAWTITLVLFSPLIAYAAFNVGSILLTKGSIKYTERSTAPSGGDAKAAGAAVLYMDSANHKLKLSNDNAAYATVLTDAAASIPDSALSSNVALLNAANVFTNSSGQTVGAAGTGTNAALLNLSAGSGAGGSAFIQQLRNSVVKAQIGVAGANTTWYSAGITDVSDDLGIKSTQKIIFGIGATGLVSITAANMTNGTGRFITSGSTPTASIAAGFCTTPSVAVQTGSSDEWGTLRITTGSGCAAATGSVTLTFSTTNGAYGTNGVPCTFTPLDAAGAYDTGVTWKLTASSTTAQTLALKNGGTIWTSSTTYDLHYHCMGR